MARAVVLNVGVGIADNNVRRDTASFAANYQTADGRTAQFSFVLPPGGSLNVPVVLAPTSVLVLNVDNPVRADVSFSAVTVGSVTRQAFSATLVINKVMVLDDAVNTVVLQNTSSTASTRVLLTQG